MREQVRELSSHVNSRMCYMSEPLGFGVTSAAYVVYCPRTVASELEKGGNQKEEEEDALIL